MSVANVTTVLPNPDTPMAFLDPALATKITNKIYAAVGSLAVLIWDILLHLPQDYTLVKQHGIRFSLVVYFVSRFATLGYIMGLTIFITAPHGNCDMIRQVSLLYPFTIPLILLLFVFRVSALYNNNKYIIAFFSLAWLSVLAASIAIPTGVLSSQIGTTKYCLDNKTPWASKLLSFCPFVHNAIIFGATSWALMRNSYSDVNVKNGLRVMVLGEHLPAFSRSVLRDGQAFFLVTLILNVFFIATSYMPNANITPCTVGLPYFVLVNNMACYVYRNIRFRVYRDHTIITAYSTADMTFKSPPARRSTRRTDIRFLEEGFMQEDSPGGEKKVAEISLPEEIQTCSSKDTTVDQQDTKEEF